MSTVELVPVGALFSKAEGHDFAYVTFPGAGHGLLDVDPPPPPEVIPTIVEWAQNVIR